MPRPSSASLRAAAPPAVAEGDPFAAERLDSALVVRPAVFGGGYALVLNKFPGFADHALLITAAAVPQARRLDRDDLDALHRCASVAARVQVNFHGICSTALRLTLTARLPRR